MYSTCGRLVGWLVGRGASKELGSSWQVSYLELGEEEEEEEEEESCAVLCCAALCWLSFNIRCPSFVERGNFKFQT